jgi:glycosyltransferase involved in cell wall biosynthesis
MRVGVVFNNNPKVLMVQNYAGTGGTEGVSLQILENSSKRITYSYMELICGTIRTIGGSDDSKKSIERIQQVVSYDPITQKQVAEQELVRFNFNLQGRISCSSKILDEKKLSIIGRKDIPGPALDLDDKVFEIKTGKIGEQIRQNILKGSGAYRNIQLSAKSLQRDHAIGILKEGNPQELNDDAKAEIKRALEEIKPDIIYVAQDHATRAIIEIGYGLKIPVVYGIHREDLSLTQGEAEKTACVAYNARASREGKFAAIIGCSPSVYDNFMSIGGGNKKFKVIPNGIDSKKFARNGQKGKEFRRRNKIPLQSKVVTIAGRYSKEKDFYTFIRTAVQTLKENSGLHFVMCGSQVTEDNLELYSFLQEALTKENLSDKISQFHLMGFQDMPAVFSASDVEMSTSMTESWGLTLLEGAAAGNIIVHSDVPGMNHAMKETTENIFRVKREDSSEKYKDFVLVTEKCIQNFKEALLAAVEASNDKSVRHQFFLRAQQCDIKQTVKQYEDIFVSNITSNASSIFPPPPVSAI